MPWILVDPSPDFLIILIFADYNRILTLQHIMIRGLQAVSLWMQTLIFSRFTGVKKFLISFL